MFSLIFCTLFALSYAQTTAPWRSANTPGLPCYCPPEFKPVCTTDGSFDNLCFLKCAQRYKIITLLHWGLCEKRKEIEPPCFCSNDPIFIKPVCEVRKRDGSITTFKSRCIRECVRRNDKYKDTEYDIFDGMCQ